MCSSILASYTPWLHALSSPIYSPGSEVAHVDSIDSPKYLIGSYFVH